LVRNLSPNHGHLTRNLSLYYVRRFRTHAIHERKGRINGKRHRAIVTESEDSGSDCLSNLSNQVPKTRCFIRCCVCNLCHELIPMNLRHG
jgi:hypothetical protein